MAVNIASKTGLIKGRGGITPHMRFNSNLARWARSSLSLTDHIPSAAITNISSQTQLTFRESEKFGLQAQNVSKASRVL